jgi:molybdate transport system substrate-binding protein
VTGLRVVNRLLASVLLLGLTLAMQPARSAEVRVLCSVALKAVAEDLFPQFEKATGNKVVASFAIAASQKRKAEAGEPFDLIILTPSLLDDLIGQGKVAADTRTIVARSGLAFVVKAGARKPDVGTTEAFRKTLLDAKSITYTKEGASGVLFAGIIRKLGIAEALAPKTQYTDAGEEVGANVLAGRAELGVLPVSEILPVKGAEVGGVFPPELQQFIVMAGGANVAAAEGAAARELLKFLTSPSALPVLKKHGMDR